MIGSSDAEAILNGLSVAVVVVDPSEMVGEALAGVAQRRLAPELAPCRAYRGQVSK